MDGFGTGKIPASGLPLAAGEVLGIRWWSLRVRKPHWANDPAKVTAAWLTGAYGRSWKDGPVLATCEYGCPAPPMVNCGCGFWAYWQPGEYPCDPDAGVPVCGVIEGSGKTAIGPLGFRCQHARIRALATSYPFYARVLARFFPTAEVYTDMDKMLAKHHPARHSPSADYVRRSYEYARRQPPVLVVTASPQRRRWW